MPCLAKSLILKVLIAAAVLAGVRVGAAAEPAPPFSAASPSRNSEPLEEVTVTAHRLDQRKLDHVIIPRFVQSHGSPNPVTHQVGRWTRPWSICLKTTGLNPAYADFVSHRVIVVATRVGAPVAVNQRCAPTVEIIFAPDPQAQLNYIAAKWPAILGNSMGTRTDLVTFNHPIRAWYETETKTVQGWGRDYDDPLMDPNLQATARDGRPLPINNLEPGDGGRFTSGITSGFANVLIIVDSTHVAAQSLTSIADYIAMLVLSRTALDGCSELPSIVDLLSADCGERAAPQAITAADFAYLKSLYSADLTKNLAVERNDLHDRMLQEVLGR